MKTILVTGGCGFIGSQFLKRLKKQYPDYKLVVLDSLTYAGNLDNLDKAFTPGKQFEFVYGDVREMDIVRPLVQKADIIVHFAAESHVARSLAGSRVFFTTDVVGTQTIAQAVALTPSVERFIHISSSEVYGTAANSEKPMTTDDLLNPLTPYASAKAGADRLVYAYMKAYGIPATIVRPFNQYGPRQHIEKAIPRFITSLLMDQEIVIHGDGSSTRDWMYVRDLSDVLIRIMHAPEDDVVGKTLNIGTGVEQSILDIALRVANLLGKKANIRHIPDRPGQVKRHCSDTADRLRICPDLEMSTVDKMLPGVVKWYTHNRQWWQKMLWMSDVVIKGERY